MKTLKSFAIITFIATTTCATFVSCTEDQNGVITNSFTTLARNTATMPFNSSNNSDSIGLLHTEISDAYYDMAFTNYNLANIISNVQAVADTNSNFTALKSTNYQQVSLVVVQNILDNKNSCISTAIANANLSTAGKTSLSTFMNNFIPYFESETDGVKLFDYIKVYEDSLITSSTISTTDINFISTITSITRHSAYLARKKPKKNTDQDWTILIANVSGAIEGLQYGEAEAITTALVAGIAQNKP